MPESENLINTHFLTKKFCSMISLTLAGSYQNISQGRSRWSTHASPERERKKINGKLTVTAILNSSECGNCFCCSFLGFDRSLWFHSSWASCHTKSASNFTYPEPHFKIDIQGIVLWDFVQKSVHSLSLPRMFIVLKLLITRS